MKKDSGYAWFIVVGCCMMNAIIMGFKRSGAILFLEAEHALHANKRETGFTMAIGNSLTLFMSPAANIFATLFGSRKIVFIGGLLYSCGLFASRFATDMLLLNVTYGLLGGIGSSLCYAPSVLMVGLYFERRRALANGLSVAGSGLGAFILAPLIDALIGEYGYYATWTVLAGISLHLCVCGVLYRPFEADADDRPAGDEIKMETQPVSNGESNGESLIVAKPSRLSLFRKVFNYRLLTKPTFLLFLLYNCVSCLSYASNYYIAARVIEQGHSETTAAILLSVSGASDLVGRLLSGVISDRKTVNRKLLFKVYFLTGGGALLVFPLLQSLWMQYCCVVVTAMSIGMNTTLLPVVLVDILGVKDFPTSFALTSLAHGIGMFVGPPVAGWLIDSTGRVDISLFFCGGSLLLSAALAFLEPCVRKLEIQCCTR